MHTENTTSDQRGRKASDISNRQHVINLGGKDYILFAGLLDEAHKQGLESVKTSLVQVPTKQEPLAVVSAEVVTQKGTFHGLGDASPENVNAFIAPHLIRMAETRAVARAFRFATNVPMTAFEELGANGAQNGSEVSITPSPVPRKSKMTQEEYIRTLCEKRSVPVELELEIHKLWDRKTKTGKFPVTAASYVIDKLKDCPKKAAVA